MRLHPVLIHAVLISAALAACACNLRGAAASREEPPSGAPRPQDSAAGGTGGAAEAGEDAEPGSPSLGRPFSLAEGEKVSLGEDLEVTFVAVLGDSRCPKDVQCIWEGKAEIEVEIVAAGEEKARVELESQAGSATRATYRDYTLALLALDPYPSTEAAEPEPYRATLEITHTGAPRDSGAL